MKNHERKYTVVEDGKEIELTEAEFCRLLKAKYPEEEKRTVYAMISGHEWLTEDIEVFWNTEYID